MQKTSELFTVPDLDFPQEASKKLMLEIQGGKIKFI